MMKNCVVFIGLDIIYNLDFKNYIKSVVSQKLDNIQSYVYIEDYKEFSKDIEFYKNGFDNFIIFVSSKYFTTISKVIASMCDDDLVLNGNILVPSSATVVNSKDFVVNIDDTNINLVLVNSLQKIDNISISSEQNKEKLNIFGLDSESVELLLKPISQIHEVKFSIINIIDDWNILLIDDNKIGSISAFINSSKELLGSKIISEDVITHIIRKFSENNKKVTFAESCTGGLIASTFVKRSGSSTIFDLGVVSYSNEVKNRWLNVGEDDLFNNGAVSTEVVSSMANNILLKSKADYSIAVSGIAGPTGATQTKNVGTVFIAVFSKSGQKVIEEKHFDGNREYIQKQTVNSAICSLVKVAINEKVL
jgi:nicotinamide-nucleotide amidase